VSITEELLGRNSSGSGQENREYDRGIRCADHARPSIRKSLYFFATKRRSLGRHSSLADQSHGVFFKPFGEFVTFTSVQCCQHMCTQALFVVRYERTECVKSVGMSSGELDRNASHKFPFRCHPAERPINLLRFFFSSY
jgi:hypothetical protein